MFYSILILLFRKFMRESVFVRWRSSYVELCTSVVNVMHLWTHTLFLVFTIFLNFHLYV